MTHQLRNLADAGFKVELFEHLAKGGANFMRIVVPTKPTPRIEWVGSHDGWTFERVEEQEVLDDLNADYAAYLEARKEQAQ